jgi:hypothetical protein
LGAEEEDIVPRGFWFEVERLWWLEKSGRPFADLGEGLREDLSEDEESSDEESYDDEMSSEGKESEESSDGAESSDGEGHEVSTNSTKGEVVGEESALTNLFRIIG